MADSEREGLTEQEKKLVKDILTRAYLSLNLLKDDELEQMNILASAINKICEG